MDVKAAYEITKKYNYTYLSYITDKLVLIKYSSKLSEKLRRLYKLEEEEDLGILTRFKERHTKGCYNAVIKRYFLTSKPYTLKDLY